MPVNTVLPELIPVPSTAHSPNSDLPVIAFREALIDRAIEGAFASVYTSEWPRGGHWKISREQLTATPHYHATTHEAYTVLKGSGTYLLGKSPLDPDADAQGNPVGVNFVARAGDAWVTHFVTDTEDDHEIFGYYSLNDRNSLEEPYDIEYALDSVEETDRMREKCRQVPLPVHDPIYGKEGPLLSAWKRDG
ncbi:hypothetical protein BDV34DRAFT_223803 [Aspergillus parasiticus]|uniref:Uncharacterized protein n=1 Tax=Aspergillus parasiticus TaxID=5067 RepID=A0A5N6DQ24_ASPPA|nr:hypothetical protein BDV34DRAFT_223803 [Aspergillus parasiticus]